MVHRKGRSRDYRSLQVREPYVEPDGGGDAFEAGLNKLGWTIGPPDSPVQQEMEMAKSKPFEDVRVPPSYRQEEQRPGRRVDEDDDDDEDEDEEDEATDDQDDEGEDLDDQDEPEQTGDDIDVEQDEDEDEDEDSEPDDEDDQDEDEADEPEPVKAVHRKERSGKVNDEKSEPTKNEPAKKGRGKKAEPDEEPRKERGAPDQALLDAVLQSVDERLTDRLTEVVGDVVSKKLEALAPKKSREKERAKSEPVSAAPQVLPITTDHIYALSRRMPSKLRATRDLAMVMLGLSAALKRSEILSLRVDSLVFYDEGMIVVLPGRPQDLIFVPTAVGRICTVRAVANWYKDAGLYEPTELKPRPAYLFRRIQNGAIDQNTQRKLPKKELARTVRRIARRAGLDPDGYDWRSLRAGFLVAYEASRTVDEKIDALRRG